MENELLQLQLALKFCLKEIIVVFKFMRFKGGSFAVMINCILQLQLAELQ